MPTARTYGTFHSLESKAGTKENKMAKPTNRISRFMFDVTFGTRQNRSPIVLAVTHDISRKTVIPQIVELDEEKRIRYISAYNNHIKHFKMSDDPAKIVATVVGPFANTSASVYEADTDALSTYFKIGTNLAFSISADPDKIGRAYFRRWRNITFPFGPNAYILNINFHNFQPSLPSLNAVRKIKNPSIEATIVVWLENDPYSRQFEMPCDWSL